MTDLATNLRARANDPETRKVVKYSMVSAVSVVVTMITLFLCVWAFHFNEVAAQVTASIFGAVPSYYLNRMWVWGKSGKSHMKKEVIPFWIMFAVGLGFSSGAVWLANLAFDDLSHGLSSLLTTAASFFAYALLWVGKYVIFNKLLFVNHEEDLDPVLDGRSGIPT